MSVISPTSWFVYLILASDQRIYTGITTDVERRWKEHCSGIRGAKFFRGRRPKRLLHIEKYPCRSSASRREAQIKRLPRAAKLALVASETTHEVRSARN